MFPHAQIRIAEPPHVFLQQMRAVIDATGTCETRITLEPPGDMHSSTLGFAPQAASEHEGLVGLFVSWSDEHPQVRLQTIASRWNPEWPTYAVVRATAERLFLPFIAAYNRKYGKRYRGYIETPEGTLPRMPKRANEAFRSFAATANLRALHPLDWNRFYSFVRVCYACRAELSESDIAFFLRRAGFASEYADQIAEIFRHCFDFYVAADSSRARRHRRRRRKHRNGPLELMRWSAENENSPGLSRSARAKPEDSGSP